MTDVIGKKNSIVAISGRVTSTRFWGSGGQSFAALEVNGQAVSVVSGESIFVKKGDFVSVAGLVRGGALEYASMHNHTNKTQTTPPFIWLHVLAAFIVFMIAFGMATKGGVFRALFFALLGCVFLKHPLRTRKMRRLLQHEVNLQT